MQLLAARFGWHPLDVEDVLSRRERPKVDAYTEAEGGGYLFAVLHFPVYDAGVGRLNAGELDVFVGPDYLVTLPTVELHPLSRLFQRCYRRRGAAPQPLLARLRAGCSTRSSTTSTTTASRFSTRSPSSCARSTRRSTTSTPRAKERVRDIHKVKQEIISYRKIVRPQRPTLRQLERGVERFLPEELELYFDDIVDASERIWDLLDNYKEVVEALEDTNESLISHQQNDILYVLTIFSVVMLPLTFITGFFGMNVHFPGFDSADGLHRHRSSRWSSDRLRCSASSAGRSGSRERLWAPWRLEYVQSADEQDGCFLCAAAASDDDEAHLVVHRGERAFVAAEQVPVRVWSPARRAEPARPQLRRPRRRRGARGPPARAQGIEALRAVFEPEGFNLGWNIGRIAGAGMPGHGHLHVVPRWGGDTNFMPVLGGRQGDPRASARDAREARAFVAEMASEGGGPPGNRRLLDEAMRLPLVAAVAAALLSFAGTARAADDPYASLLAPSGDVRARRRSAEPRPACGAARDGLPHELRTRAVRPPAAAAEHDARRCGQCEARRRPQLRRLQPRAVRAAVRRGVLDLYARGVELPDRREHRLGHRLVRNAAPDHERVAPLDRAPREHPDGRVHRARDRLSPNQAFLGYAGAALWSQEFGARTPLAAATSTLPRHPAGRREEGRREEDRREEAAGVAPDAPPPPAALRPAEH